MMINRTDEQNMLEDMIIGILTDAGIDKNGNVPLSLWPKLAELGLLALPFAEEDGGMGGSAADLSIVARQLGKVPGELPFLGSVVMASVLVRDLASEGQKANLIESLIAGDDILAIAHDEPGARYRLSHVSTRVSQHEGRAVLEGIKTAVMGGALAQKFIVSARVSGSPEYREGVSLFIIPADADGVLVTPYITHDGRNDADVSFKNVEVLDEWQLGASGVAMTAIEKVHDLAIAVSCSEALGAMEELLDLTIEYLKVRKQFGVPLASFQALKHKAVDMFIDVELAKSMTAYAIMSVDENTQGQSLALQATKAQVNGAARFVAETAVQLHGAIGMTMETKTGRLFQRLTNFQLRFGDRHHCLQSLIQAPNSILES